MKSIFAALLFACVGSASAQPYVFAEVRDSLSGGVGYNFSQHFGAELAYFKQEKDHSNVTGTASGGAVGFTGQTTTQDVHGARLSLLGGLPVSDKVSVLGSLSAYSLKGDLSGNGATASGSGSTYGAGFGASYAFNPKWRARLMFDWTKGKDDFFGSGLNLEDIKTVALSVVLSF